MDSIGISIGIESLDLESISISIGIEFLTLDSISIVSVSKKLVSKVSGVSFQFQVIEQDVISSKDCDILLFKRCFHSLVESRRIKSSVYCKEVLLSTTVLFSV